jgi:sugar lactone lactonase YvrE
MLKGYYWMAGVGGWQIVRITPQGAVDRVIEMPVEKPTKPIFGGPNLDVMYVTSLVQGLSEVDCAKQPLAGGVFAITGLGVSGLDHVRFAG